MSLSWPMPDASVCNGQQDVTYLQRNIVGVPLHWIVHIYTWEKLRHSVVQLEALLSRVVTLFKICWHIDLTLFLTRKRFYNFQIDNMYIYQIKWWRWWSFTNKNTSFVEHNYNFHDSTTEITTTITNSLSWSHISQWTS